MGTSEAIQDGKSERTDSSSNWSTLSEQSEQSHNSGTMATGLTVDQAEDQFGMQIPDTDTLCRLQSTEQKYGHRVHKWVAEGMPTEIMGNTMEMVAFRERQADRPATVPTNIERQNNRSVRRSETAAAGPARAGETGVPEPVRDVISSTGRSLDESIQQAMDERLDDSFGDVQIHTGPTATAACEALTARAFTVGNHVVFNQGEYDPESPDGQRVLAHELAHVRQQTVSMLPQEQMDLTVDPDPHPEHGAEEAAQQAMTIESAVVTRMGTEMYIQRSPHSEK